MNMKMKTLAGILAVGALVASGSASALPWSASGTIGLWKAWGGAVLDGGACPTGFTCNGIGDSDTTFTWVGGAQPPGVALLHDDTKVFFSEREVGGVDFYNVDFSKGDTQQVIVGNRAEYRIVTTDPEGLNGAALGSQRSGPEFSFVEKIVRDETGAVTLLALGSTNGAREPAIGYAGFAPTLSILVQDNLGTTNFESLTNEYRMGELPEPATLALFGIGLLGLLGRRRAA